MTRAEFAAMLTKAAGKESGAYTKEFLDVTKDQWFYDSVMAAAEAGFVSGMDETHFAPDELITREQLAVMIYRAAGEKLTAEKEIEASDFSEVSEYAKEAVDALLKSGLIAGYEDGSFRPKNYATRAEAAVLISKIMEG